MKLSKKSGIMISAAVGALSAAAAVGYLVWKKNCADQNCCKLEESAENVQNECCCTENNMTEHNCCEAESASGACCDESICEKNACDEAVCDESAKDENAPDCAEEKAE